MKGIERATETGPEIQCLCDPQLRAALSSDKNQKEMLANYLVKNFGPGTVEKRLKTGPAGGG